jgi:hypothetical protein
MSSGIWWLVHILKLWSKDCTKFSFIVVIECAYVVRVCSRGEVDSLRHVKQGWQKPHQKKSETVKLDRESEQILVQEIDTSVIKSKKTRKPKTSMEFDRDWRRLKSTEEKHG